VAAVVKGRELCLVVYSDKGGKGKKSRGSAKVKIGRKTDHYQRISRRKSRNKRPVPGNCTGWMAAGETIASTLEGGLRRYRHAHAIAGAENIVT